MRPSSAERSKARSPAKRIAELAVPELAVPLAALSSARKRRSAAPLDVSGSPNVVMIPPRERRPLIQFGRDKVRITTRKGVTFVQVERAHHLGILEAVLFLVVGTAAAAEAEGIASGRTKSGVSWRGPYTSTTEGKALGLFPIKILNLPFGVHVPI